MKKLVIFLMLMLSMITYSQDYIRIGKNKKEILKEFRNTKTQKGFEMVLVNIKGNEVLYTFDNFNICDQTTIVSKDNETADRFKLYYDSKSFKINNVNILADYKIDYTFFLNTDKNMFLYLED